MRIKYGIIFVSVALALLLAATPAVSAYSISVTSMKFDTMVTDDSQNPFGTSKFTKTQSAFTLSPFYGSSSGYTGSVDGSVGSVRAYSSNTVQNEDEFIKFSESVSVNGIINKFHYSAHFES